jgi:hypothetical protein
MEQINALLAFYLKINPDTLDDEEWSMAWQRLKYALEYENKSNQSKWQQRR